MYVSDFNQWKKKMEEEERVFYIMKVRKSDGKSYYECTRSGESGEHIVATIKN